MSLFKRHRSTESGEQPAEVPSPPGLAEHAASQGWQPAAERPFDGHLEDAVHEITRVMYGAPRDLLVDQRLRIGDTVFRDAFRAGVDGRGVVVANGWTNIQTEVRYSPDHWRGVAVCAAELPSMLMLEAIHPRRFPGLVHARPVATGNPEFDERFVVTGPPEGVGEVLTPEVQRRVMARDDWSFRAERYLFGCVSKGPFDSVAEIDQRIEDVLGIIAAIPSTVIPDHVDHSADDIIARIDRLTSVEEAMARMKGSTATKMQLFTMFMRVRDDEGGSSRPLRRSAEDGAAREPGSDV